MKLHENIAARVMREMPPFKEAEQLLELVQTHFSLFANRARYPKVIILGSGFLEEYRVPLPVTSTAPAWCSLS